MTAASFVGINYALIFYGLTLLLTEPNQSLVKQYKALLETRRRHPGIYR